jgi:hypothetical protein
MEKELQLVENGFKRQFRIYLTYKDDADLMDDYERTIESLVKDNPII